MKKFHASLQKYFCVLFLSMITGAAQAQTQMLVIPQSKNPLSVQLDGVMDETAWRNAAPITGFLTTPPSQRAEPQTSALVIADNKYLYVGFVCDEPNMDKLVHQINDRQGSLWTDDCVEFFLDPTNSGAWIYHWIVNPNGAVWEGLHATGSGRPQFESAASAAAHIGAKQWSGELKIPLASLMTMPQTGQIMSMNIARERKAGDGNELSSWSPTEGSFLDPQTLRAIRLGSQNNVQVTSLGSGSDAFNHSEVNQFTAEIAKAAVPVKVQIFANDKLIGHGRADFPGALSATYQAPTNATVKFEVSQGKKVLFTSSLKAPPTTPRVWQVPDPLYTQLLGNGEPASQYEGVLMWSHNTSNPTVLRQAARRFGLEYVMSDMFALAAKEKYRLFGSPPSIDTEKGKASQISGEKYVYMVGRGTPWVVDPEALEKSMEQLDAELTAHGKRMWAVSASDEIVHLARREGADLMENPEGYDYIKVADEEVRTQFGDGKFGIPHGQKDPNPYRWIAFNKWLVMKFHQRAVRIRQIIQKHNLDIPLVSYDPQSRSDGNDYSGVADDYDIWTHQTYQRANQWTTNAGFHTKYLADLTGKEVWPCVHVENYAMATTPEEAREQMSEVFRNGGSGFHFYLPDTANGDKVVGDTRLAYFGSPRRYNTIVNVINLTRNMPKLHYPKNTRTAIVYNDDMLQSTFSGTRVPMYSTEAAYTFLGPAARSWFTFIDNSKVLLSPSLNEQFDTIFLPIATYQRPEIVARLRQFVANGGTLVCGDAKAFDTDTFGNNTSAQREEIFGVSTGEKSTPKVLSVKLDTKTYTLSIPTSAYKLTPRKNTHVLGTFADGSAAVTSHRFGKGRAILFSSNPFNMDVLPDSKWRVFFTDFAAYLGAPINLDIWRFQFPDSVLGNDIPTPAGQCLTNNHVTWREEKPLTYGNVDLKGKYQLQPAPDAMPDVATGWIPFTDGHLTDRRKSMLAEKVEPKWYVGFKLPDGHWMNSWKDTSRVTITYDLQQQITPGAVQFWFNDTMPSFEVQGSKDQESWQRLGANMQIIEAGQDVKKLTVDLKATTTSRYIRVVFAPRNAGQKLSLVESEIWGKEIQSST